MTPEDKELLTQVLAEAQAARAMIAALIASHPNMSEVRAHMRFQFDATMATLLNQETPDRFATLVEGKMLTYFDLVA